MTSQYLPSEGFIVLLYPIWQSQTISGFLLTWCTLCGKNRVWGFRSRIDVDPFSFYSSQLPVAVKSLRSSLSRQTDTLTDFLQEVTTMQSLDHPNIIRLYGVVLTQPLKMVRCLLCLNGDNIMDLFKLIKELEYTMTHFSFL